MHTNGWRLNNKIVCENSEIRPTLLALPDEVEYSSRYVRFGLADILRCGSHVRFTPESVERKFGEAIFRDTA